MVCKLMQCDQDGVVLGPQKHTISLTTDAAGDAVVVSSRRISGKLYTILFTRVDTENTLDISVVTETGLVLLQAINVAGSTRWHPRVGVCGTDENPTEYAAGFPVEEKMLVANETVTVTFAQGGDTKSGTIILFLE